LVRAEICPDVDARLLSYLSNIVGSKKGGKKKKGKKGKKKKKKGADTAAEPAEKKEEAGKTEETKDGAAAETKASPEKKTKKKKKGKKGKKAAKSAGEKALKKFLGDNKDNVMMSKVVLLVKTGILKNLEAPLLSDFIGDHNILGSYYQKRDQFDAPSMAQLRATVTIDGILPLGEQYVKDMQHKLAAPTRAMLFVGPNGSGKSLLSKAIAGHTGALFMDLSPANVAGCLENKETTALLVHLCFDVAKRYSKLGKPTVIYIDECERVWSSAPKSKKAEVQHQYAKFSSDKLKYMKKFLEEEKAALSSSKATPIPRILIVGNTSRPTHEFCDKKGLQEFFGKKGGKILFTPIPDYSTRMQIWKRCIENTSLNVHELTHNRKFNLSILSHISAGYSAGTIRAAVEKTLSESKVEILRKILASGRQSELSTNDFVSALSKQNFCYQKEYKKFIDYANSVNGEKKRREIEAALKKEKDEIAGSKTKKGGPKKKRKPKKK